MTVSTSAEISNFIAQVMEAEKDKYYQLETRKSGIDTKNSAWAEIDSSLEALQKKLDTLKNQSTFTSKLVSSTNNNVATATASTNAVQTTFQLQVKKLAQAAKVTSSSSLGLAEAKYASLVSAEVNTTSGVTVDPNVTFANGSSAIKFDSGKTVVSGSFKINGRSISVTGNDTIYTILSKINSSSAGVTATFDSSTDKITLTSSKEGSDQTISLTEDTSGFLGATKLLQVSGTQSAVFTNGSKSGYYDTLSNTSIVGPGKIQNGYFTINNITFSVDTATDSVNSIIGRINNSAAGVNAFYDDDTGKITITSRTSGKEISFENDTSNFLKTINVLDQSGDLDAVAGKSRYAGTGSEVYINGELFNKDGNTFTIAGTTFTLMSSGTANVNVAQDNQKAITAVRDFVNQYNNTISVIDKNLGKTLKNDRTLANFKREIQRKVSLQVTNSGQFSGLGELGIKLTRSGGGGLGRMSLATSTLTDALNKSSIDVAKLFADDTDNDGVADDQGFSISSKSFFEKYTKNTTGIFASKISVNNKMVGYLDKQIEKEEERLAKREEKLRKEYEELNSAVSKLDGQSQSLSNFFSQMSSITSSYYQ